MNAPSNARHASQIVNLNAIAMQSKSRPDIPTSLPESNIKVSYPLTQLIPKQDINDLIQQCKRQMCATRKNIR
jgi:hypothetical protein